MHPDVRVNRNVPELGNDTLDVIGIGARAATRTPLRLQLLMGMPEHVNEVVVHLHLFAELLLEFVDAYLRNVRPYAQYVGKVLDPDLVHDIRSDFEDPEFEVCQVKAYQQQISLNWVTLVRC